MQRIIYPPSEVSEDSGIWDTPRLNWLRIRNSRHRWLERWGVVTESTARGCALDRTAPGKSRRLAGDGFGVGGVGLWGDGANLWTCRQPHHCVLVMTPA
jgi:hypothetical protein